MRCIPSLTLFVCLSAGLAAAQSKPYDLNSRTPQATLLNLASQEEDVAKKTSLLEDFVQHNPKDDGMVYAGPALQELYLKAGNYDAVITLAGQVLAVDPATPVAAYNALQACEKKQDNAGIITWVTKTVEAARALERVPKPDSATLADYWSQQQDYARQVVVRCEYSLFNTMLRTGDAQAKAALGDELMKLNPHSQYWPQVRTHYIYGLMQTGRAADAAAMAEQALATDQSNADLLLVVADHYLTAKEYDKAAHYAAQLIAAVTAQTAPEGVAAADWTRANNAKLARGHYIAGSAAYEQQNYAAADKEFRAALPLAAGNNDMLGPIYFYLGFANHQLARAAKPPANRAKMAEARKFTQSCAAIVGPYQETCRKNLAGMAAGK